MKKLNQQNLKHLSIIIIVLFTINTSYCQDSTRTHGLSVSVGPSMFGGFNELNSLLVTEGVTEMNGLGIGFTVENGKYIGNSYFSYSFRYSSTSNNPGDTYPIELNVSRYSAGISYSRDLLPSKEKVFLAPELTFFLGGSEVGFKHLEDTITSTNQIFGGGSNEYRIFSKNLFTGLSFEFRFDYKIRSKFWLGIFTRCSLQFNKQKWRIDLPVDRNNLFEAGLRYTLNYW